MQIFLEFYISLKEISNESPLNDAENPLNIALDNSASFKYKASLSGKATDADGNDRSLKNTKIAINCKIHLEINWNNNCVMYAADTYAGGDNANNREATFKITSPKLYVPIVTLSTKDNLNLTNN